jgi:hypothetical protein
LLLIPPSPEMNPREIVDLIRSGPAELVLREPIRFRRRTRSNPCGFNEFLQALQSTETIRSVDCCSYQELGITADEWVLLTKTIGSIKGIQCLKLQCKHGSSHDFHPFQAVADAVNNAHSLLSLKVFDTQETLHLDQSGILVIADALRQHPALQEFIWIDVCSPQQQQAQRDTSLDPVFRALLDCTRLRKATIMTERASSDALRSLLHSPRLVVLTLVMNTEHWLAVADEIRQGRNKMRALILASMFEGKRSETTEAVQAIASAIRQDRILEILQLQLELPMDHGITDEAGVALAEALTVNKTLSLLDIVRTSTTDVHNRATLGARAYEAFSAMLRVNTSLTLTLPPVEDTAGGDPRVLESHDQLRIEQRLNTVGRGRLLSSSQTATAAWVDALHELNAANTGDTCAFQVSCLYSLLRLNPAACMLHVATPA